MDSQKSFLDTSGETSIFETFRNPVFGSAVWLAAHRPERRQPAVYRERRRAVLWRLQAGRGCSIMAVNL